MLYFLLVCMMMATSRGDDEGGSGLSSSSKIVGGEPASPGEFPYQVFIEKIWNSTKIFKCGGAIYNKDFVITAAHCLYFRDLGEFSKPKKIWVTAGTHDLVSTDPEIKRFEQVTWGQEIFPHPSFKYENYSRGYNDTQQFPIFDIALVKLAKSLEFNERVQPIPLPMGESFKVKGNGTMAGWGRPDVAGRWTRQLRKVSIPLVDWKECGKVFKGSANITRDMFCTGTRDGKLSPCYGDSGGPIACLVPETGSSPVLCGVQSFGAKSCSNFSVYTKLSSYLGWIGGVTTTTNGTGHMHFH